MIARTSDKKNRSTGELTFHVYPERYITEVRASSTESDARPTRHEASIHPRSIRCRTVGLLSIRSSELKLQTR